MLETTEKIIDAGLGKHVFNNADLTIILGGSASSRYGKVNRAIKQGELTQLRRGLFTLNQKYLSFKWSKYHLASRIVPLSFVSAETALAYHGWIPEKVVSTISTIASGKSRQFDSNFDRFAYYRIPCNEYEFFNEVERVELNQQSFFMAKPLRALMDFVYNHKIDWQGMNYLTEGLRIEAEYFESLTEENFKNTVLTYSSKRVHTFLSKLMKEVL